MAKKTQVDIEAIVAAEIAQAEMYQRSELAPANVRAIEYRDGIMRDTPAQPNRSEMVSRDVSDTIDKMLPPIMRTFTASGRMWEFEPQERKDEEGAEQAGDLLQHAFFKENNGYGVLYNANYDALLLGDGVVKVWWDDTEDYKEEEYEGIDEATVAALSQDPDMEILEQEPQDVVMGMDGQPIQTYEIKVKRIRQKGKLAFVAIPREDFLYNPDCTDLDEAIFVGMRCGKTRSELIEMGFKKADVQNLGSTGAWDNEEKLARGDGQYDTYMPGDDSNTLVTLYEVYVKVDINGDGKAECIRAYYAGKGGAGTLLEWEEAEGDHPFEMIPCEPVPHKLESQSIAEKMFDIQQLKTVMVRAAIDNQYAHNNPQPIVVEGAVINKDSITSPKFGQPIVVRKGVEKPLEWRDTPYIGDKVFGMLQYLDAMAVNRTGMSDQASALDPETLQNQSATAAQLQHDIKTSRAEMIARNMAEGWRRVGRKALKLLVANQDRAKTIKLRGEWVDMDPRSWNADMDVNVNVGLGTGSRDRDMAMLNVMLQSQYALAAAGVQNGQPQITLEMLPKIVNTLIKQGEAAGIRNADDYYIDFSEEKLQQMQQIASQPKEDPKIALEKAKLQQEGQIAQANMQLEQQKIAFEPQKAQMQADLEREKMMANIQQQAEIERMKAEAGAAKETAQMQADILVKREEMAMQAELERQKQMFEMEKFNAEMQLEREKMAFEAQLKREEMASRQQIEEKKAQAIKQSRIVRDKEGRASGIETTGA